MVYIFDEILENTPDTVVETFGYHDSISAFITGLDTLTDNEIIELFLDLSGQVMYYDSADSFTEWRNNRDARNEAKQKFDEVDNYRKKVRKLAIWSHEKDKVI